MRWCCIGFSANYESAGERGKAILVGRDSLGAPEFVLQIRSVDKGKEPHIQSDVPISIIIDFRIVFCPWCGTELAKFYQKDIDVLHREGFDLGLLKN